MKFNTKLSWDKILQFIWFSSFSLVTLFIILSHETAPIIWILLLHQNRLILFSIWLLIGLLEILLILIRLLLCCLLRWTMRSIVLYISPFDSLKVSILAVLILELVHLVRLLLTKIATVWYIWSWGHLRFNLGIVVLFWVWWGWAHVHIALVGLVVHILLLSFLMVSFIELAVIVGLVTGVALAESLLAILKLQALEGGRIDFLDDLWFRWVGLALFNALVCSHQNQVLARRLIFGALISLAESCIRWWH